MRFHMKFDRNKGAGATDPVLGNDAVPTGRPKASADNVLSAHVKASWGASVRRVAVIYNPPSGTQVLDGELYLYDGLTETWHKLAGGGVGAIKPGEVVYFDVPAISDKMFAPGSESANHASGFDVALVVATNAGAADGVHTFAMAAIVSQKGN